MQTTIFTRNKTLTEVKNEFVKIRKQVLSNGDKYNIELQSTQDERLYHGKRVGYVTAKTHTVKSLFFLGANGYANCELHPEEKAAQVFYVPAGRRSSGYGLHMGTLESITFVIDDTTYRDKWASIAASMRKHNINLEAAQDIENHLNGLTDHINGFDYRTHKSKPRCNSFKDVTKGLSIAEMAAQVTDSQYSKNKIYYKRIYGQKRDRSITLSIAPDGTQKFYAASEYSGCGNGDYYLMYSPTMAVFVEKD